MLAPSTCEYSLHTMPPCLSMPRDKCALTRGSLMKIIVLIQWLMTMLRMLLKITAKFCIQICAMRHWHSLSTLGTKWWVHRDYPTMTVALPHAGEQCATVGPGERRKPAFDNLWHLWIFYHHRFLIFLNCCGLCLSFKPQTMLQRSFHRRTVLLFLILPSINTFCCLSS